MLSLFNSFLLLFFIFGLLFVVSFIYTYLSQIYENKIKSITDLNFLDNQLMKNYMAIIFIFFGMLKLYDLKGFVEIFSKYDLISKKIKVYGYFYLQVQASPRWRTRETPHVHYSRELFIFLIHLPIIMHSNRRAHYLHLPCAPAQPVRHGRALG